jgi:hypothetical protein
MLLFIAIVLAFVALMTLLINPTLGIPLILAFKPVIDTQFYQPLIAGFTLTVIVGTAVPFLIMFCMLRASKEQSLRRMPLRGIWLTYAAYVFLFAMLVVYNKGILDGMEVFLRHINGFIGFYMIQAYFREPKKTKAVLLAYIIGGLFTVGVGMYQLMTGKVWLHTEAEGLTRNIGLYYDVFTVRFHAIAPVIALLLYTSFYTRSVFINSMAFFYGLTAIVVIYRAYTKAGMLALAFWAVAWTVLQKKFVKFGLMVALLFLILPFYAGDILQQAGTLFRNEIGVLTGQQEASRTLAGRWGLWDMLFDEWLHLGLLQQIFGSGMKVTHAHNDYLQMLFHGGMIGLTIFVSLLVYVGTRIINNLRRKIDPLAVAALMLYVMYIIDSLGLVPSSYPAYQWLTWGLIGLSFRLREDEARQTQAQGAAVAAPAMTLRRPLGVRR